MADRRLVEAFALAGNLYKRAEKARRARLWSWVISLLIAGGGLVVAAPAIGRWLKDKGGLFEMSSDGSLSAPPSATQVEPEPEHSLNQRELEEILANTLHGGLFV